MDDIKQWIGLKDMSIQTTTEKKTQRSGHLLSATMVEKHRLCYVRECKIQGCICRGGQGGSTPLPKMSDPPTDIRKQVWGGRF